MSGVNWNNLKGKKIQFAGAGKIYRGSTLYQPMLYLPVTFLRATATRLVVAKNLFTSDIDAWIDDNISELPQETQTMISTFVEELRNFIEIFPEYSSDLIKLPLSVTNCTLDEFEYLANESLLGTQISYIAKNKSSLVDDFLKHDFNLTTLFGVNDDITDNSDKYGVISMDLSWVTLYSTNVVQIYKWDLDSLKLRFRRDDYSDLTDQEFEDMWDQMEDTVLSKKNYIEGLINERILYYIHSNDLCDMFITATSIYFYGLDARSTSTMGNLANVDMTNIDLEDTFNQIADSIEAILTALYMFTMLNQGFFDGSITDDDYEDPILGVNPRGHFNLMDLLQNVSQDSFGVQVAKESGLTNDIPISGGGSISGYQATSDAVSSDVNEYIYTYGHTWINSYFDGYLHYYDGTNYGAGADGSPIYPIPVDHPYTIDGTSYNDGGLALSEAMVNAKVSYHRGLYLNNGTEIMWVPKFYGWSGSQSQGISDGRTAYTYSQVLENATNTTAWHTTRPTD